MFLQDQSIFWYLYLCYFQHQLGKLGSLKDIDFATFSFLSFGSCNHTQRFQVLLCDGRFDDILLMQLQLTLTVFLLKILYNLLDFGKCCFNNFRNVLPVFVLTLREKKGLKQFILRFHCFYWCYSWYLSLVRKLFIIFSKFIRSIFFQCFKIHWCGILENLFVR